MLNIAIVAGGDSGEYGISIGSGRQVEKNIDRAKFTPYLIEIRGNRWIHRQARTTYTVDRNDFSLRIGNRKIRFHAVFNAIHGTPGENGILQGYLDLLNIPYTSCDVMTSALTFNKAYCKAVVSACPEGPSDDQPALFREAQQRGLKRRDVESETAKGSRARACKSIRGG
jgi:D-alanine-D-alanine ligase